MYDDVKCGRCGHGAGVHGRRGFGSCRYGQVSPTLAALIDAEEHASMGHPACACKRFRVTPPRPQGKDKEGGR